MSRFDRNKEYECLTYERPNIKGRLTKYELLVGKNEFFGCINDLFIEEFELSNDQFKRLLSNGFLNFDYDDLKDRYKQDLLCMYEEDIEEDYQEQLADERWYYGVTNNDEEHIKTDIEVRAEYGVTEDMFH